MDCEQQINSSEQIKMTEEIKMTQTQTEEKKWYEGLTAAEIEAEFAERERRNYAEIVAPIIPETEFHTNIVFPTETFSRDPRFFTTKWATTYDPIYNQNKEAFVGYALKKGKKITQSQLDRLTDNEEFKRAYAKNTILTVSQTTADHSNQDLYEDITARLDKGKLRYAFKDRIPKGKHIFAVLVPTRSNPAWKNCPNYDIPYKNPVMMVAGDAGAIKVRDVGCFAMNPLGDAIIVLKD
jgi:hypothetical protein